MAEPVVPGIKAIKRRRQLMEDEEVLAGEPDKATEAWRAMPVDKATDNEKTTYGEDIDTKPELRKRGY